jgi:hypothetical protein
LSFAPSQGASQSGFNVNAQKKNRRPTKADVLLIVAHLAMPVREKNTLE